MKHIIGAVFAACLCACVSELDAPDPQFGKVRAAIEENGTKVSFDQMEGSLSLVSRWNKNDKIQCFVLDKNGELSYTSLTPSEIENISDDAKTCDFGYPERSDSFRYYFLTSECNGFIEENELYCDASLRRSDIAKYKAPVISYAYDPNSGGDAMFYHYLTYELLHVENASDAAVSFEERGFNVAKVWFRSKGVIRNSDGQYVDCHKKSREPVTESGVVSIPAHGSVTIVSSYYPNGQKIADAQLVASVNGATVNSSNTISSDKELKTGRAYHMYAKWDGNELKFTSGSKPDDGYVPDGAVDLGLSVHWASVNVGASSAYDAGSYFAWGETTSKKSYSWETYSHSPSRTAGDMGTYNATDNLQVLYPEDDVAHERYGGNWRMPTSAEWQELRDKCTWEEDKDGEQLLGYQITSKVNGKTIYLPVSGYMNGEELVDGNKARYWSSSRIDNSYCHKAWSLFGGYYAFHDSRNWYGDDRRLGMPVRAVYDDCARNVDEGYIVDLGLSVKWSGCNLGATSSEFTGDRFAWGESNSDSVFGWEQYEFGQKPSNLNKYNGTDNLQYLERENDIAYALKGGNITAFWRIPTIQEWQELKDNCTWTEATKNGNRGYVITSKINQNSIFLPISGVVDGEQIKDGMRARYWSSSREDNIYPHKARSLNDGYYAFHDSRNWYGDDRCLGMPVRPVYVRSAEGISSDECVDLGLSVKWSGANLGATSFEESGKRFAWGEKETKTSFLWESYSIGCDPGNLSKYNGTDNLQYLEREDDVLYNSREDNSDSYWRIPTIAEWQELKDNCTWSLVEVNCRRGYKITGKNGRSIFLPIVGFVDGEQQKDGMRARYWSSSREDNKYSHKARSLNDGYYAFHDSRNWYGDDRCLGMPVRGIFDDSFTKVKLTEGELVDMGVSVLWASCNLGATLPEETGDYYAWGEDAPKDYYRWDNYKYSPDGTNNVNKYNGTDNLQYLERDDDLVFEIYKGRWRTPTIQQWSELYSNCEKAIVSKNGRRCILLTSKVNGNTLLIPISGIIDDSQHKDGMRERYWSSSREDNKYSHKARSLNDGYYAFHDSRNWYGDDRCLGMPIRAIYTDYEDNLTPGELVDLGLSVKWASCNLGAELPEEFGNYYAWGATAPYDEYSWNTYRFGQSGKLAKYNADDDRRYLDWNDDVVHVEFGGNWRMPTIEEWQELKDKCTWTETVRNGIKGYEISGNGNSIFLPIAGLHDGLQTKDGMRARYWSSSREDNKYSHKARSLNDGYYAFHDSRNWYGDDRCLGMPVRGVYDDSANHLTNGNLIDLGLSVRWASRNVGATNPEDFGRYYAWAERESKSTYDWSTYEYCSNDNASEITKYYREDKYYQILPEDDPASSMSLRMPTIEEWQELKTNCVWTMKIKNGHLGYVVTSKANGNSIFLPIAGLKKGDKSYQGFNTRYWASDREDDIYPHKSRALNDGYYAFHDSRNWYGEDRCLGMPVRGVE